MVNHASVREKFDAAVKAGDPFAALQALRDVGVDVYALFEKQEYPAPMFFSDALDEYLESLQQVNT